MFSLLNLYCHLTALVIKTKDKQSRVLIAIAWILSLLFSTPALFINKTRLWEGNYVCDLIDMKSWHMKVCSLSILHPCYTVELYSNGPKSSGNLTQMGLTFVLQTLIVYIGYNRHDNCEL